MEASSLTLDYKNITVEPFAVLSGNGLNTQQGSLGNGFAKQGSSGAGHGGHGGQGSYQPRVGVSYGNYRIPTKLGSTGGADVFPFVGGLGGGRITIIAHDTLNIDGTISSRGSAGIYTRSGGGSGGSILVYASRVHGDGEVDVSGGDGDHSTSVYGGGGAAGRISIYYRENHFLGKFLAFGGSSRFEDGGPGTVYLDHVPGDNVTYGHDRIDEAAHGDRVQSLENEPINGTKWVQNRYTNN
jgi:hypothetical protein